MNNALHAINPQDWADLHFGQTKLTDRRRQTRAQTIAEALVNNPGSSIPQLFTRTYDIKAAYSFFDHQEATPENIQATHKNRVFERINQPGTYLLIEDGSEFNWNDKIKRVGLGAMHKNYQGFILQTSLAVEWFKPEINQSKRSPTQVIGITHQEYYARVPKPENEANQDSKKRKTRARESQLWERSSTSIGKAPDQANIRWVRVADRGADIEFFLRSCINQNHGFVVRAAQNRCLVDKNNKRLDKKLFELTREQPSLGEFNLELRSRPGQAARIARLSVSVATVNLRSSYDEGKPAGSQAALACSVVRVWEANPEADVEGLEWILLCDTKVESFEDALEIGLQYAARWLIEEYHKCLKTGLGADDLQLETAGRLYAAISFMAVVAVKLLALKEGSRVAPEAAARESGLDELELEVLSLTLKRKLRSVKDVALALGRLGGHMNRKSDGMPGWQSLWIGMKKLQTMVDGVRLAKQIRSFGV
jgi:Transposase DNA-binding/Transposase Tn5 dimerisation domain